MQWASDTPMGKQGGEFEPAPGIRGWWIIYADIFLYDGDNRNLMLIEMRLRLHSAGDFRSKNLLNSFRHGRWIASQQSNRCPYCPSRKHANRGTTKRVLHTFKFPCTAACQ